MTESTSVARVAELVTPIVVDLKLELYDIEFRGGTLRITIDTPPSSEGGVNLDVIALATRLISRDLDHHDPVPGHYVLEVSSPGLERPLRTPAHFRRELGKDVSVRLRDIGPGAERRMRGRLVAADDEGFTVLADDGVERTAIYDQIDRAKTVFEWGPTPKKGGPISKKSKSTARHDEASSSDAPRELKERAEEVSAANGAQSRAPRKGTNS